MSCSSWLLRDVDASYQEEEEEIPEALQTPEELEEANVVSDNELSEEELEGSEEEGIRKRKKDEE